MATLLSYALCTVEDVKETLGITGTAQDNLIIRKINSATEMIEKYTGTRFASTVYTDEEYDATNSDQLILKHRPVITFTSLSRRDTSLNQADWDTIDTELYFVDFSAGVLDLIFHATGHWNRYRVTYTAGYAVIPADIVEACITLASYYVENPVSTASVRVKEEGQRRIEYYDTQSKSSGIYDQLNLTDTLNAYADYPVLADK